MDPDATYARWRQAVADGDWEEAEDAHWDLREWLVRGGFEPSWTERQRTAFFDWNVSDAKSERKRLPPIGYIDENPLSDLSTAEKVGVVAVGTAALGIVGYLIWNSQQTAAAAAPATPTLPVPGTPAAPAKSGADWSGVAGQASPYVANGNATTYTGMGNSQGYPVVTDGNQNYVATPSMSPYGGMTYSITQWSDNP